MHPGYVVFSSCDDGEVFVRWLSPSDLRSRLIDDWWGSDPNFLSTGDIAPGNWDYANEPPRGIFIFRADALVIPKAKEVVTEWVLE